MQFSKFMRRTTSVALIAGVLVVSPACRTSAGTGALVGAGGGAAIGAAIDNRRPVRGALIGAALGALIGGAIGNEVDKREEELARRAHVERRVVYRDFYHEGDHYHLECRPARHRVVSTLSRYDPYTGEWVVVEETVRDVY